MKKIVFLVILMVSVSIYFYLGSKKQVRVMTQPEQSGSLSSHKKIEHDFEFSSQEREQMTPANKPQPQGSDIETMEQVFSPPPEQ